METEDEITLAVRDGRFVAMEVNRQPKMFAVDGKRIDTFNPITGCRLKCVYCYFRKMVEKGRLKNHPKYRDCGIGVKRHNGEFHRDLGKNKKYFVVSMGDMWGSWVKHWDITQVLEKCGMADISNEFWFLTKHSRGYFMYFSNEDGMKMLRDNFIFGVTIETNRHIHWMTKAHSPKERFEWMMRTKAVFRTNDKVHRIFMSIEPIIVFDEKVIINWVKELNPEFVYVGYDNHNNFLPEPRLEDTKELIESLGEITEVRCKTVRKAWYE